MSQYVLSVQRSDLPHLVLALKDVHHNWQLFGSQLGLLPAKLKDIKAKNGKRDPTECFREALEAWFESGEVCTCRKLVAALKDCDNKKLSVQFSEQHSNELDGESLHIDAISRIHKSYNFEWRLILEISRIHVSMKLNCPYTHVIQCH